MRKRTKDPKKVLINNVYAMLKNRHKKKGFKMIDIINVEKFEDVIKRPCNYCGAKKTQVKTHKKYDGVEIYVNGIDRIDSLKGYIYGNVVSCCMTCNNAKGVLSYTSFLKWVQRVYLNNF